MSIETNTTTYTNEYGDEVVLTYSRSPFYGETGLMHRIRARQDGKLVGELYADLDTGQVMQVAVIRTSRNEGEGIARAMVSFAAEHFEVFHSPDEY